MQVQYFTKHVADPELHVVRAAIGGERLIARVERARESLDDRHIEWRIPIQYWLDSDA